jgi:hypothetical protein
MVNSTLTWVGVSEEIDLKSSCIKSLADDVNLL